MLYSDKFLREKFLEEQKGANFFNFSGLSFANENFKNLARYIFANKYL